MGELSGAMQVSLSVMNAVGAGLSMFGVGLASGLLIAYLNVYNQRRRREGRGA